MPEKFGCSRCGKRFDSREALGQHRQDAHNAMARVKGKKQAAFGRMIPYIAGILVVIAIVWAGYRFYAGGPGVLGTIGSFNLSLVPYRGGASAGVNVIEFGDYQCPVCAAFFSQTEPKLASDYVGTGKARFYFVDFAFLGPDSLTLAQGAWCANEQGLYLVSPIVDKWMGPREQFALQDP